MIIMTSYFYQVRFMTPNMLPMSTAMYDPKWFKKVRIDSRGVYNGIKIKPLVPGRNLESLCHGPEGCLFTPDECEFLRGYRDQLDKIDFTSFIDDLESDVAEILSGNPYYNEEEETIAVILFHEKYDNSCSERVIVRKWFEDNGIIVKEFNM